MKPRVAAIFDKPDNCAKCPCFYETEGVYINVCQLMIITHKECKPNRFKISDQYETPPFWCPLQELTVIGPASIYDN